MALAVLMAGITIASVKVFGWRFWPPRPAVARSEKKGSPANRSRGTLTHDQRLVAAAAEPPLPSASASASASAPGSASAVIARRRLSASEMFAAAKIARAQGDSAEALRLSKQLEEFFPNSPEGVDTHVTLGLLYLELDRADLALQEFATFRHIGSPEKKAEAYFGQAQALRKLSRSEDERTVLTELILNYPRSSYVGAARARLTELTPDAGAR